MTNNSPLVMEMDSVRPLEVSQLPHASNADRVKAYQRAAVMAFGYERSLGVGSLSLDDGDKAHEFIEHDWYLTKGRWAADVYLNVLQLTDDAMALVEAAVLPFMGTGAMLLPGCQPEADGIPATGSGDPKTCESRWFRVSPELYGEVMTLLASKWCVIEALAEQLLATRRLSALAVWGILDPGIESRLQAAAWRIAGHAIAAQVSGCTHEVASIYQDWYHDPVYAHEPIADSEHHAFSRVVMHVAGWIAERDGCAFGSTTDALRVGRRVGTLPAVPIVTTIEWDEVAMLALERAEAIVIEHWEALAALADELLQAYILDREAVQFLLDDVMAAVG